MHELKTLLPLALSIARQDLAARFAGSFLGGIWLFIWPLIQMFIYLVIFGQLMGARLADSQQSYGLYVASGLCAWSYFANTLQRTARAFVERRTIIGKVNIDLRVFPLAVCFGELVPFSFALLLLITASLCLGVQPSGMFLVMLLMLYLQELLAMGLGLILACISAFVRDVVEVVSIALQMAFWFTPIVYVPDILPDWVVQLERINPMTHVVAVFQNCFASTGSVSIASVFYVALLAHCAAFLALKVLSRCNKDLRDVL